MEFTPAACGRALRPCSVKHVVPFLALLALGISADSVAAQQSRSDAAVEGRVIDAETGQPLANVAVRILELGRGDLSHADGSFHFQGLPGGSFSLVAQRIGYATGHADFEVAPGESLTLEIALQPSALALSEVIVTGTTRERGSDEAFRPTSVVGDAELRRRLESSLAATIDHLPGITQQYNGPAAAQPVIRGMGGDRVLVLEDGQRTGDLAASGSDHAVTTDPMTARRVEVVRGPSGLIYGSNTLGGVINVVREEIPRTLPESVSGTIGAQGESVNRGATGGLELLAPIGPLAARLEITGRTAGDTRTPLGTLNASDLRSHTLGFGLSRVTSSGIIGASYRDQSMSYGVPGEFDGVIIPGAEPDGARITTQRRSGRFEAHRTVGWGPFSSIAFDANLVHFEQAESDHHDHHEDHDHGDGHADGRDGEHHEGELSEHEHHGARFENLFGSANLVLRHEHAGDGLLSEGAIGFQVTGRDLTTEGEFTGTRDARTHSFAAFIFEEIDLGRLQLQVGGRYDRTIIDPVDRTPIDTGDETFEVRRRSFDAFSASVSGLLGLRRGVSAGVSLARAFRTPSIEELFSDGPHLADFTFDLGSPGLDAETGLGADLFVRIDLPRVRMDATLFRNSISNFIHHAPTGLLDPRYGRFPVFVARGADAVFTGAEASLQWEVARRLVMEAAASTVRTTNRETDEPLPGIPPANGRLAVRYEASGGYFEAAWRGAMRQDRVPAPVTSPVPGGDPILLDPPTAGYGLLELGGGVRWLLGGRLHTLSVQIDNVTNRVWRDHLSRIRLAAPQPGRNIRVLYRASF